MAKKINDSQIKTKAKICEYAKSRCQLCGRSRGYLRDFAMCRICFRKLAEGQIPGVTKSSW